MSLSVVSNLCPGFPNFMQQQRTFTIPYFCHQCHSQFLVPASNLSSSESNNNQQISIKCPSCDSDFVEILQGNDLSFASVMFGSDFDDENDGREGETNGNSEERQGNPAHFRNQMNSFPFASLLATVLRAATRASQASNASENENENETEGNANNNSNDTDNDNNETAESNPAEDAEDPAIFSFGDGNRSFTFQIRNLDGGTRRPNSAMISLNGYSTSLNT